MIEYLNDDFIATNLAEFGRVNGGAHILRADEIAVGLLQEFYHADNKAFASENLKPLSFRDGAMLEALKTLKDTEGADVNQDSELYVLEDATLLEKTLVEGEPLVVVAPDQHHWKFTRPSGVENLGEPYKFDLGTTPLIKAWPELRYAGILSNPADPSKPEFDAAFVLDPQLLFDRAANVSRLTEHTTKRLLQSVFVNAAQVMGRRLVYGTPEGQFTPSHWVAQAQTAKQALAL